MKRYFASRILVGCTRFDGGRWAFYDAIASQLQLNCISALQKVIFYAILATRSFASFVSSTSFHPISFHGVFVRVPPTKSRLPADAAACRQAIREVGLRATPARVAVLRLIRSEERPLSHADVCDALGETQWNRSTLWRNLCDLETAGLVQRKSLGDRLFRFEHVDASADGEAHAHPHFICVSCGDVECLPDAAVTADQRSALPRAMRQGLAEVEVRGVCDKCDADLPS